MNSSENSNKRKHENVDQIDDLTRFLDEDFDTDDVDLFEFTSEEDSPLAELKSIVLSLDWEISDATLQDLADEISRLKDEEVFQADKVSHVYLQGLAKIGQYIQSEGAHAHPNSIKLLLTFYYDFEKILSSATITGTEITALLKADVRKFKILQYQIAKRHGAEAPVPAAEEAKKMGLVYTDSEALRGIRAIILELDWEVSDEGLQRLSEQLDKLKTKFTEDRFIQILVKGLSSLKSYIYEERGRAHPEAYTLLHTFSEGIAKLIENGKLEDEQRQEIIIEQVNSLNTLKSLIASSAGAVEVLEEDAIKEVDEGAVKVAEIPGQELEALAEEGPAEALDIAPALAGELEGSEIREETPPEELEERLEFFFGEEEKAPAPVIEEPAVKGVEEIGDELEPFDEESLAVELDLEPALAGDDSEGTEITEEAPPEELAERLEFFFGSDDEVGSFEGTEPPVAEEREEKIPSVSGEEAEWLEAEEEIVPALAGSPEEGGFGIEEEPEEPPAGMAEKLEDFFGVEEPAAEAEPVALAAEEEPDIMPALAGESEESEIMEETPPDELKDKLEYFFGAEEETAEEFPEGEEEVLLTSALTDEAEAAPAEAARPMKSEAEYQAAVVQIRSHFKKVEDSLRQEIATLEKEIETLRAQLKSQ